MKLTGKVALITGASRGLGKAYAETLMKNGAKVSIVDILKTEGEATKCELENEYGSGSALYVYCDVTKQDQMEAAYTKTKDYFGRLDIVVNNAGVIAPLEQIVAVNLTAVMRSSYLAVDHMSTEKGGNGGVIINISSIAGFHVAPDSLFCDYNATKHGVLGFTKSLAVIIEQTKCGIRINTLCPAFVHSDLTSNCQNMFDNSPIFAEYFNKFGGWLKKEDLANQLLRLVEDDTLNNEVLLVTSKGPEFKPSEYSKFKSSDQ